MESLDLSFHPLTQKLWRDFELLFGNNGACGGCWCMYWKLRGKEFSENTGDNARQMQKSIVDSKIVPGLLAYLEGYPVGWIAVEPRMSIPSLPIRAHSNPLTTRKCGHPCSLSKETSPQRIAVDIVKAAIEHVKIAAVKL